MQLRHVIVQLTKFTYQEFIMSKQISTQAMQLFLSLAFVAMAAPSWAAPQTVALAVPGMTCASCPITVKHAITKVNGVSKINVDFDKREAVVTFDDSKTNVLALTTATANAGYPSSVKR